MMSFWTKKCHLECKIEIDRINALNIVYAPSSIVFTAIALMNKPKIITFTARHILDLWCVVGGMRRTVQSMALIMIVSFTCLRYTNWVFLHRDRHTHKTSLKIDSHTKWAAPKKVLTSKEITVYRLGILCLYRQWVKLFDRSMHKIFTQRSRTERIRSELSLLVIQLSMNHWTKHAYVHFLRASFSFNYLSYLLCYLQQIYFSAISI